MRYTVLPFKVRLEVCEPGDAGTLHRVPRLQSAVIDNLYGRFSSAAARRLES